VVESKVYGLVGHTRQARVGVEALRAAQLQSSEMRIAGFHADPAPPEVGLQRHGLRQAHAVVRAHVDEKQWRSLRVAVLVLAAAMRIHLFAKKKRKNKKYRARINTHLIHT